MITGKLTDSTERFANTPLLQKALDTVASLDLSTLKTGRNDIDGDDIYINVMNYSTNDEENRIWEAHRQYLDVHFLIDGTETMQFNTLENMNCEEYQPESDYVPATGTAAFSLTLTPGTFVICLPDDVHKTGVAAEKKIPVRKAVMKVRIA